MTRNHDFRCISDPIPKLDEKQHAAFLNHVEKALLYVLEKKTLLTQSQWERCMEELENPPSAKR